MKRFRSLIAIAVVFVGGAVLGIEWQSSIKSQNVRAATPTDALRATPTPLIAAAGRVEPVSEEISIGSELDGRLSRVLVEEGTRVGRGQVVAELENRDFVARVDLAEAALDQKQAVLDRLRNGARTEEKRESQASVREAEAVLDNAQIERDRRQTLLDRGAISRYEFDTADREYRVAKARLEAVRERHAVVEDQTRPEDLRRAEADVDSARAQLAESEAMLAKTIIRTPVSGIVLRKKLKAGESVSSKGDPPILTLGDTSKLRIRVDVDENDVAKLHNGQQAWVTAPAYGDKKFTGKVVQIGQILGRKNVRTDEPSERADKKILETLVELDAGQSLPIGLRVDAYIEVKGGKS